VAEQLGERIGSISARRINGWVQDLGALAATPLEMSTRLTPSWGGVLGVDGKAIWAAGREGALMVAVDQRTRDVVHALVTSRETTQGFHQAIHEAVAVAGYPLKGLVTDAFQGVTGMWRNYFAAVPLQLCRVHYDRGLDFYLPSGRMNPDKQSPRVALRIELKARLRDVIHARTERDAWQLFAEVRRDQHRYLAALSGRRNPIRSLEQHWDHFMAHHRTPDLPADNNITENVIKQFARKLRLIEGFGDLSSADCFLRLLVARYRFRRFTDAKPATNHRSPLELAGVPTRNQDWLAHALTLRRQH